MRNEVPDVLRRLTPEEAAQVPPLSDEEIESALDRGYEAVRSIPRTTHEEPPWRFR